jgi:hypothetical protein
LRQETAEAKAERIMAEELLRRGWTEADMAARRESDPGELANSARLRRETTPSTKSIATGVHLGASKSGNARPHAWMRSQAAAVSSDSAQLET